MVAVLCPEPPSQSKAPARSINKHNLKSDLEGNLCTNREEEKKKRKNKKRKKKKRKKT